MHIVFFTDNFPPESNAPASRTFEHAREWIREGHSVTVVTTVPNFPTGRVFAGYRNRLWQREIMDGIAVVRVWSYLAANEGFARRIIDFVSYMVSASVAGLLVPRPNIIVATSPQFFTLLAGSWTSFWRRCPWVCELRDIWPESIKAVGAMRDSAFIRVLEKLELWLYRDADRIIVVASPFAKILADRGIDPSKIDVVTNGVDLTHFEPIDRVQARMATDWSDRFVVGYVGTHGMAHALDVMIDAAVILACDEQFSDILIVLAGDGASKRALVDRALALDLDNLRFLQSLPKENVPRLLASLDAAVVHLRATPLFDAVLPSKIFETMAMGVPVLLGVSGEAKRLVLETGVGIGFEAENPQSLVEALLRLKSNPELRRKISQRAQAAAPDFDRCRLAKEMLRIMEETARS